MAFLQTIMPFPRHYGGLREKTMIRPHLTFQERLNASGPQEKGLREIPLTLPHLPHTFTGTGDPAPGFCTMCFTQIVPLLPGQADTYSFLKDDLGFTCEFPPAFGASFPRDQAFRIFQGV